MLTDWTLQVAVFAWLGIPGQLPSRSADVQQHAAAEGASGLQWRTLQDCQAPQVG